MEKQQQGVSEKRTIIGLVGESGSGKDTVADYIKHRYHAISLRFSDPIKEILRMFFDRPSRADQGWLAVTFKERFGKDIFCRALEKKLLVIQGGIVTLNGLRYPEDLTFLRSLENAVLIYVTASRETRWKRVVGRGEKSDDDLSFEEFVAMEESLETERFIPTIGKEAEYIIENEGSMDDLLCALDEVMKDILRRQ